VTGRRGGRSRSGPVASRCRTAEFASPRTGSTGWRTDGHDDEWQQWVNSLMDVGTNEVDPESS
jgi:hypothetical protein